MSSQPIEIQNASESVAPVDKGVAAGSDPPLP